MNFKISVRDTRTATMKRFTVIGDGKTTLMKMVFPRERAVTSWTVWGDTVGRVIDEILSAAQELADVKGEEVVVKIDAQYGTRIEPDPED